MPIYALIRKRNDICPYMHCLLNRNDIYNERHSNPVGHSFRRRSVPLRSENSLGMNRRATTTKAVQNKRWGWVCTS